MAHVIGVSVAWALALAWSAQALAAARGIQHVTRLLDPARPSVPSVDASVVIIVPACNEESGITACIQSLLEQDWPHLHVIAVDDRSSDSTGLILDELASKNHDRLSVLHIASLPPNWLGKTHAMAVAAEEAEHLYEPRWLLFTDADVIFHTECIRRSLAVAEEQGADHFVTLPSPIVRTAGEGIILSFLQAMGIWAARLWRVSDPKSKDAVGIGAFVLLRSSAYKQIGRFERLRLQVLEDLTLARLIKQAGLRQRVALAPHFVRVHWAPGLFGLLNTMTKNLFAIFGFRLVPTLSACGGLALICLGPYAGLFWSPARIPSTIAIFAIACLYWIADGRLSDLSALNFLAFPLSAMLFLYAVMRSVVVTIRHGGVTWRGTLYPLEQLRREAIKLR